MDETDIELNIKELFIIDHALRLWMKRENANYKDIQEENKLLDKVNCAIKQLKWVRL